MTFNENLKPETKENPKELPQLSPDKIQKIRQRLPEVRQDITRLLKHFDELRKNYPNEFEEINQKHPNLTTSAEAVRELFNYLGDGNKDLSNEQFVQALNEYNLYANKINSLLRKIKQEREESRESTLVQAAHGELPFNEADFTPVQKKEIRAFAQQLWQKLFPESGVDKFTKWATGQKDLEGYQKILLAPANGIESAVMGFIDLFEPKTYKELSASIESLYGLNYKDWCDIWRGLKFTYERLPTTDKIAPVLSLICAIAFLKGGSGKIVQMAKEMGYSIKTISAIKGVFGTRTFAHVLEPVGKAIPLSAILGITLPYIKSENGEN
jgi:hypothetical protein